MSKAEHILLEDAGGVVFSTVMFLIGIDAKGEGKRLPRFTT
jgi:hypothetical protein